MPKQAPFLANKINKKGYVYKTPSFLPESSDNREEALWQIVVRIPHLKCGSKVSQAL
jgi:hypothetical protein